MDGRARWRRPWPRLAPEVADGLLGIAVVATQLLLLGLGVNQGAPAPFVDLNGLAVALILLQGLPLTWRRRYPVGVFGVVLAANTAYYAIGFPPSQFDFGLPLAVFSVAAERDRRTSLAALATVQGLMAVQWAVGLGPYWSVASWVRVLYLLFFFSAMWAWGRYVRVRRAYAQELAARAERAERDRQREADRAVAAERARIARELHDVIAHHMSVMVIQAGAARRLLDVAPDQARGALAAVEDAGRRGLEAVPGLLRALREDDRPDGLAPQPTLAELDTLIAQVSAAGLPVDLRIEGTPAPCRPPSTSPPTASPRRPSPTPSSTPAPPKPSSPSATASTPWRSPPSTTVTDPDPPTRPAPVGPPLCGQPGPQQPAMGHAPPPGGPAPTGPDQERPSPGTAWSACASGCGCSAATWRPGPGGTGGSGWLPGSRCMGWRGDPGRAGG